MVEKIETINIASGKAEGTRQVLTIWKPKPRDVKTVYQLLLESLNLRDQHTKDILKMKEEVKSDEEYSSYKDVRQIYVKLTNKINELRKGLINDPDLGTHRRDPTMKTDKELRELKAKLDKDLAELKAKLAEEDAAALDILEDSSEDDDSDVEDDSEDADVTGMEVDPEARDAEMEVGSGGSQLASYGKLLAVSGICAGFGFLVGMYKK